MHLIIWIKCWGFWANYEKKFSDKGFYLISVKLPSTYFVEVGAVVDNTKISDN